MVRRVWWVLLGASLAAAQPAWRPDAGGLLSNGASAFAFDAATGALRRHTASTWLADSGLEVVQEGKGNTLGGPATLDQVRDVEGGVDVAWHTAAWQVVERWRERGGLVLRSTVLTPVADGPPVQSVRFRLTLARPTQADAEVVAPAIFPPLYSPWNELAQDRDVSVGNSSTNRLVELRSREAGRALVVLCGDRDEPGWANVRRHDDRLTVQHAWNVELEPRAGQSFTVGTQVFGSCRSLQPAVAELSWQAFEALGERIVEGRPVALDTAVIYSAHAGGTIDSNFTDTGGFKAMAARLPYLKSIGVTHLWLLPFWKGPVYAPVDYGALDEKLGTEADLKALVDQAHGLGLKVLGDLVPHGPRPESGLLAQHFDWVSRDRQGQPQIVWGCLSCDYAQPGWQQAMAEHAVDWVRRVGLDGYRVDVAPGGPPNWRPAAGKRPSMSGTRGSIELLTAVRKAMRAVKPDAILIAEGTAPHLATTCDLVYDFPWAYEVLPRVLDMPKDEWVVALDRWLHWRPALYPRGTRFMRYTESHDTVRAKMRYGPLLAGNLAELTWWAEGVPMWYDRGEEGLGLSTGRRLPMELPQEATDVFAEPLAPAHRAEAQPEPKWSAKVVGGVLGYRCTDGRWLDIEVAHGGGLMGATDRFGPALAEESFAEGDRKLFVGAPPLNLRSFPSRYKLDGDAVTVEGNVGPAGQLRVTRRWTPRADGTVDAEITLQSAVPLTGVSTSLVQRFASTGPGKWSVQTLEGRLGGRNTLVDPQSAAGGAVTTGWRYRHPVGPLWQSDLLPLAGWVTPSTGGNDEPRFALGRFACSDPQLRPSVTLAGTREGKSLTVEWLTPRRPLTLAADAPLTFSWTVGSPTVAPVVARDSRLTCEGARYTYQNADYRLTLGRSAGGTIRELRRRAAGGVGPNLLASLNTYTDSGLYGASTDPLGHEHRINAGSINDVEPDVAIDQRDGKTHLTFEGVLSSDEGMGMELRRPFSWYRHEYTLDDGPVIRLRLGFRARSGFEQKAIQAFVAHTFRILGGKAWTAIAGDGTATGTVGDGEGRRVWESRQHPGPREFRFDVDGKPLVLRLAAGAEKLQNAFVLTGGGPDAVLFLAPFDNQAAPISPVWQTVDLEIQP